MDNSSFDDSTTDSCSGVGLGDGISAGVCSGCSITGSGAAGGGISTRTACGTASSCTDGNWGFGGDGDAVGNFSLGLVTTLVAARGGAGATLRRCVTTGADGGGVGTGAGGCVRLVDRTNLGRLISGGAGAGAGTGAGA